MNLSMGRIYWVLKVIEFVEALSFLGSKGNYKVKLIQWGNTELPSVLEGTVCTLLRLLDTLVQASA